jgi:tetratricopeptide (TPR) repeat protein
LKTLLLLILPLAAFGASRQPAVPECFKVHSLIKMDGEHYWADWSNACPFTIDSVYVIVKFAGRQVSGVIDGVWALHFVTPGTHRVTRFNTPGSLGDFDTVQVRKITVDSEEALHNQRDPQVQIAKRDPNAVADPGPRVEGHQERGRALLDKGEYQAAVEELSQAIREKPDLVPAYNARGFAYLLLREYGLAVSDLNEAIRLNPGYLDAYQNRSQARKAIGDLSGSEADAKKAHSLTN